MPLELVYTAVNPAIFTLATVTPAGGSAGAIVPALPQPGVACRHYETYGTLLKVNPAGRRGLPSGRVHDYHTCNR